MSVSLFRRTATQVDRAVIPVIYRHRLVIFAKTPQLGRVKRRLAAGIGYPRATNFYRQTASQTIRSLAADPRWETCLALTPDIHTKNGYRWPGGPEKIPQGTGHLGQRMGRVMAVMPPGPVVIVGTDLPDLRPDAIARAFAALGNNDAVFGPADDGGYWLVGLKRRPCIPEIFHNVRWSSEHALADTLANFRTDHRIAQLEQRRDIDDAEAFYSIRRDINSTKLHGLKR